MLHIIISSISSRVVIVVVVVAQRSCCSLTLGLWGEMGWPATKLNVFHVLTYVHYIKRVL